RRIAQIRRLQPMIEQANRAILVSMQNEVADRTRPHPEMGERAKAAKMRRNYTSARSQIRRSDPQRNLAASTCHETSAANRRPERSAPEMFPAARSRSKTFRNANRRGQ